jgi:hypothetical protein
VSTGEFTLTLTPDLSSGATLLEGDAIIVTLAPYLLPLAAAAAFAAYFGTVSDRTTLLVASAPHAGRVTHVTTKAESGTCTAVVKINGTPLGGTSNSASTTSQTQLHASANTFAQGDEIAITTSANAACTGLSATIRYSR